MSHIAVQTTRYWMAKKVEGGRCRGEMQRRSQAWTGEGWYLPHLVFLRLGITFDFNLSHEQIVRYMSCLSFSFVYARSFWIILACGSLTSSQITRYRLYWVPSDAKFTSIYLCFSSLYLFREIGNWQKIILFHWRYSRILLPSRTVDTLICTSAGTE